MKRLIRYSAAGLAQMGTVCCPNCFGQAMPQLPLSCKNWSEHERAEIGRLEAVCSETNHCSLDCDHTDEGDPWCVIYDHQHHRIDAGAGFFTNNARGISTPRGGRWYAKSVSNVLERT